MCSRYEIVARPRDLAERFRLPEDPLLPAEGEVRPTDRALVVMPGQRSAILGWGLPSRWDGKPLINARAETLTDKPTFRPLLENRCLVLASAYFEWRRDGRARLKNRIAPDGAGFFAFAGLTDGTHFTIVTCPPATTIAHIHDRMPVILDADAEARWLDADRPFRDVCGALTPYAAPLAAREERPRVRQPDLFG